MECFSNPPHHVKTISNQGKALRTHRICAKASRHRGKCQDGWMAIQMSYHCSWVLSCGVYSITASVVTLQVLCKYVILFTIDLDSVLFVLRHVGSSVDAVLCSQIGIHWRVQPSTPPVILSPPSLGGTQPSKTSDRQANGNGGLRLHNIPSLPPSNRCLASVCKHPQQGRA